MSTKLISAAYKADLPKGPKATLVALADIANKKCQAWPSVATITGRTGRSRRSVQGDLKFLVDQGHITREDRTGETCCFLVHPHKNSCTRAESAPVLPLRGGAQNLRPTGAVVAPKPSNNLQRTVRARARAHEIPSDWKPSGFEQDSESGKVIAAWPAGELAAQIEQFKAHHASKGNRFIDPQKAWSTWVLNTRRFGIGKPANGTPRYVSASGFEYRGTRDQVKRKAHDRNDMPIYWQIIGEESREKESAEAMHE